MVTSAHLAFASFFSEQTRRAALRSRPARRFLPIWYKPNHWPPRQEFPQRAGTFTPIRRCRLGREPRNCLQKRVLGEVRYDRLGPRVELWQGLALLTWRAHRRYAVSKVAHLTIDERKARGKGARSQVGPSGHAGWEPAADRPDPVALLEEQNVTREPDLVPVRHGRMLVSPFTFYRGAAKIMAADLKDTPTAGLNVQLCGDAHLSNFGVFASPERTLLFDLNDFDETLPGPFEYDVKRMAASFTIAARNNGFANADARAATLVSVAAYREAMAGFAEMPTMDIWYARLSEQVLLSAIKNATRSLKRTEKGSAAKMAAKRAEKIAAKAHTHDSLQALSKLAE